MTKEFDCLITETTRTSYALSFSFELMHQADEGRMMALIGNRLSKGRIGCRVTIGQTRPVTPFILDRWSEGPLTYCLPEDVAGLEASHAELLEAATNALWWWDGGNKISPKASGVIDRLRAAIAKAKGEQP